MLHPMVEDWLSPPDFMGKGVIPLRAPGAGWIGYSGLNRLVQAG